RRSTGVLPLGWHPEGARQAVDQGAQAPQQDHSPAGQARPSQARRAGGLRGASYRGGALTPPNHPPLTGCTTHAADPPHRQPATRTPTGGADGAIRLAPVADLGGKDLGDGLIHWVAYWVARSITWDAGRTAVEI